jgi:putative N6-adenine-specific DNA methylase
VLRLFAITAPGLERITLEELRLLGYRAEAEPGGVSWDGGFEELQVANLRLRTASRVLVRVAEFTARTFPELERHARKIPWDRYLPPERPVQWRVTCRKSRLYHQGAVEQRFAEAVERALGTGPPASSEHAEEDEGAEAQMFVVRFFRDRCTVSADSSGALLHRRGYRLATAKAPLRETLAAGALLACGWTGEIPLIDPMCGSGSIPIEAALLARRIAPGVASADRRPRPFAFQQWPTFDRAIWERTVAGAVEEIRPSAPVEIQGSDRDAGAVEAAHANAARAGVADDVHFSVAPVSAIDPPGSSGLLLTNPPYGIRVGESKRVRDLYAALGTIARERLRGWRIGLFSADRELERQIGIALHEQISTRNGGIPVRVLTGDVTG